MSSDKLSSPMDLFQSTLSVRRATTTTGTATIVYKISIHALRKESDAILIGWIANRPYFNPRSP